MSMVSADERATVVRFMFLSLLSLGMATIIWVLGVAMLVVNLRGGSWRGLTYVGAAFLLSVVFLLRRFEFFNRAIRLPFDMAVAYGSSVRRGAGKTGGEIPRSLGVRIVYLAGGHQTTWRQRVIASVGVFQYRDPSAHGIKDARAYTAWDLEAVRGSDCLFAYFESTNPSGYGLAVEVGYAAALGKHVIFVDEKSTSDPQLGRYLSIVSETADDCFKTLDEGIDYLRRLSPLSR